MRGRVPVYYVVMPTVEITPCAASCGVQSTTVIASLEVLQNV